MFWRAVKENRTWLVRACHQPGSSPASPAEKLPRWKASELTAAHRSRSLGLPDKHFRKSFQKNNLDIHYLSQPSRAHSPGLPWCFQRGLWPEWQRCEAQIRHWEGIKQWSRERKQPVAAVGFAFRLGHNQSGSPLFSCSRLCLSALWRSQLSSGSFAQTLVLSFLQKINPSTNQRIIPGSAHCCSPQAGGGSSALSLETQSQPRVLLSWPQLSSGDTDPSLLASQHFPMQGPKAAQKAAPQ